VGDISNGLKFIFKEKPMISKILITIFLVQLTLAPFGMIGIPVLISRNLGMNESWVGIAQGAMGIGGIVGGILVGVLGKRLRIQKAHWLLFAGSITFAPISVAFLINANYYVIYAVIVATIFIALTIITLLTIQIFTFIQTETPPEMLGKVSALSTMLIMMGMPFGQFIFGLLFERLESLPWVVVLIAVVSSAVVALNSRRYFKRIPQKDVVI
ncbi:MAG: MFS transporter, partial [Defluviitaleaceae bacterium]|nr:MFS transporter [Defluviitaleaceae bacterium]